MNTKRKTTSVRVDENVLVGAQWHSPAGAGTVKLKPTYLWCVVSRLEESASDLCAMGTGR